MSDIFIDEFRNTKFTKNQQKIARYFSDHSYDIVRMNLSETAAAAGVSEVTILNFVRKLGYSGFTDFKASVVDRLEQNASSLASVEGSTLSNRLSRNLKGRTDQSLLENHIIATVTAAQNSLIQNSSQAYEDAVELIMGAGRVFITGARSMLGISERYGRGLSYLLDNVYILDDDMNSVIRKVSRANENDVLLLVCFSRFYKSDISVCKAARDAGVKVIIVTDTSVSPIAKYADVLFVADSNSTSFFNSTVGAVAILEYLIAMIADVRKDSLQDILDMADRYTEEYRLK